jgi:hypothetical protein
MEEAVQASKDLAAQTSQTTDDTDELAAAAERNAKAQTFLSQVISAGRIQQAYKDQVSALSDLSDEHARLTDEKARLVAMGYSPEGRTIREVDAALAENAQAQTDATEAARALTEELIFQQITAGLDAEQILELSLATGRISETQYNTALATAALSQAFKDGTITAEDLAAKSDDLAQALADGALTGAELKAIIDSLQSKEINIHTNYTSSGQPPAGGGSAYGPGTGGGNNPPATGVNPVGPDPDNMAPGHPRPDGGAQSFSDMGGGGGGSSFVFGPGSVIINVAGGSVAEIAKMLMPELAKLAERSRSAGR